MGVYMIAAIIGSSGNREGRHLTAPFPYGAMPVSHSQAFSSSPSVQASFTA